MAKAVLVKMTVHPRPNAQLSKEERERKKKLKRLLKRQMKRNTLETRLRKAQERKDEGLAEKTRLELLQLEQQEEFSTQSISTRSEINDPLDLKARAFIQQIYQQLQQIVRGNSTTTRRRSSSDPSVKEIQTEEARSMLYNMTKGKQTLAMFENTDALLGYTRLKFQERAHLVFASLAKLSTSINRIEEIMWNKLQSVKSVCSIGSGPGCDVLGVIALRRVLFDEKMALDRVLLLDWAMTEWKRTILDPLETILVPNCFQKWETASCDVRESLDRHENNPVAAERIQAAPIDLFITSYLLTETNGKWHDFYRDLFQKHARSGSLFLFADPTCWQIHLLLDEWKDAADFCWLDSSRDRPELQSLEGRTGPAVLLAMKR